MPAREKGAHPGGIGTSLVETIISREGNQPCNTTQRSRRSWPAPLAHDGRRGGRLPGPRLAAVLTALHAAPSLPTPMDRERALQVAAENTFDSNLADCANYVGQR